MSDRKVAAGIMSAALAEKDFNRLAHLIRSECGIKISPQKKIMLEARLRKRLRALGMVSFHEYCEYLFGPEGMREEMLFMINVVTTNKTDFYREPRHFEYLTSHVIPALMRRDGAGKRRPLAVWSAGCSSGEEPYTLAMVLHEFASGNHGFVFSLLATDISTTVLEKAAKGIYREDRTETVPMVIKKKYMLRSRDKTKRLVRVCPEIRGLVSFRRLNFMEDDFGVREKQDVIFCRNVIIYFDKPTQEKVLWRLYDYLTPGGYLFMGHSETLSSHDVPLVSAGNMVYRKPA